MKTAENHNIPEAAYRYIRGYAVKWRSQIVKAIEEKTNLLDRPPTAEEISECALSVILGDKQQVATMERICLEAYDAGKSRPLTDVIDELRAAITRSGRL